MAYPTLNTNEIYAAMHNQIISVMGFGDNIKGTFGELASKAKVDGSMLGDTKVYRAADVLASNAWAMMLRQKICLKLIVTKIFKNRQSLLTLSVKSA